MDKKESQSVILIGRVSFHMFHSQMPMCMHICSMCMCAHRLGAAVYGAQFSGGKKTDEGTGLG